MKLFSILLVLFAFSASAADVSGKWKGTAETANGTVERTFVFKVDGDKLTGETSSDRFGKSAITDGKVYGDNLSFTITVSFDGNEAQVNYKGKVSGDVIKFTVEIPGADQTIEYTAKRIP